jgi:type IV fimbrial biogenesis protein FimT
MKRRNAGFSLLELITAMTVLAILIGLAIPSFRQTIDNNRLIGANNDFVSALNFARSEALKRANPVSVCSSTNATACSGSRNFSNGWIAFADANANGTLDGAETVMHAWPATETNFTLTATSRAFVRYSSTGTSAFAETFGLLKTGCTGNHARTITVTVTGRIRTVTSACP